MQPQILKDRIPPYNDEAERAVLGAILVSPVKLPEITKLVTINDFYRTENQHIFKAMLQLEGQSVQIDILSLSNLLKQEGLLEKSGGYVYLSSLVDTLPTAANFKYYAEIVQDSSYRRSVLFSASELIRKAHDDTVPAREMVEQVERDIFNLVNRQKTAEIQTMTELIPRAMNEIQDAWNSKISIMGVPTGFKALDDMTQGFQKQDMIIIGARPSVGKTAFALSMALAMVTKSNVRAGFFSLEMSSDLLVRRLLASEAKLNSSKIRIGHTMHNSDFAKLSQAAPRLFNAPLFIDDTPNISLLDLRANARRMVAEHNVQIIFVDYIGLIKSNLGANIPRHEQVSEISRSLKQLSRELNIPFVILAQVGRAAEGEEPKLSDLRDSGSIEQDADIVMFLHRDRMGGALPSGKPDPYRRKPVAEEPAAPPVDTGVSETKVIIAKHRNGPTGDFKLNFIMKYTLFTDVSNDRG